MKKQAEEPLIFGYTWGEIKAAQQGNKIIRPIVPAPKPPPTERDRELLVKHGQQWLRDNGMFGVLDRLNLNQ